MKFWQK